MKVPQTFLPERSLEGCVERFMETGECSLLKSCNSFLEQVIHEPHYPSMYDLGKAIAERICYDKKDLEALSRRINANMKGGFKSVAKELGCVGKDYYTVGDYFRRLGVYLSALANKILTDEETITLSPKVPLACLGAYLEKGTLAINSDAESHAGFGMEGGKLILKKFPGSIIGALSKGGEIHIERDLGREIILLDYINLSDCKAKVYYKGKEVFGR